MTKALNRVKKNLQVRAADRLEKLEANDFVAFIENMWNEARSIGTSTVMSWRHRARALNLYTQFFSRAMVLTVKGIPVPESIIMDVREKIYRALKEVSQPFKV